MTQHERLTANLPSQCATSPPPLSDPSKPPDPLTPPLQPPKPPRPRPQRSPPTDPLPLHWPEVGLPGAVALPRSAHLRGRQAPRQDGDRRRGPLGARSAGWPRLGRWWAPGSLGLPMNFPAKPEGGGCSWCLPHSLAPRYPCGWQSVFFFLKGAQLGQDRRWLYFCPRECYRRSLYPIRVAQLQLGFCAVGTSGRNGAMD